MKHPVLYKALFLFSCKCNVLFSPYLLISDWLKSLLLKEMYANVPEEGGIAGRFRCIVATSVKFRV